MRSASIFALAIILSACGVPEAADQATAQQKSVSDRSIATETVLSVTAKSDAEHAGPEVELTCPPRYHVCIKCSGPGKVDCFTTCCLPVLAPDWAVASSAPSVKEAAVSTRTTGTPAAM